MLHRNQMVLMGLLNMLKISIQERQFIYSWICSLLSKELTQEQLAHYQRGDFDSLFAFLNELGFAEQTEQLIATLRPVEFQQLELAADFAHTFLLEGNISAIPYMSAYLQGEELGMALNLVDLWMTHYQLGVNRDQNEPSDHVSVLLAILIRLIGEQPFHVQQDFAQKVLLNWLPEFVRKANNTSSKTRFYAMLCNLFLAFMTEDFAV